MIGMTDALFDSGLKDKLRMLQEIGLLIQHVDFQQVLDDNDRTGEAVNDPLYHTGIFMMETVNELFSFVEEIDEKNRGEFRAMRKRLGPDDPAKEFKERSFSGVFKALEADGEMRQKVGAIFNEGGSRFEELKSAAESIYSEIQKPEDVNGVMLTMWPANLPGRRFNHERFFLTGLHRRAGKRIQKAGDRYSGFNFHLCLCA